jgi:hypothetical protein
LGEEAAVSDRGGGLASSNRSDGPGGPEVVGEIIEHVVGRVAAGDTLAPEEAYSLERLPEISVSSSGSLLSPYQ